MFGDISTEDGSDVKLFQSGLVVNTSRMYLLHFAAL